MAERLPQWTHLKRSYRDMDICRVQGHRPAIVLYVVCTCQVSDVSLKAIVRLTRPTPYGRGGGG